MLKIVGNALVGVLGCLGMLFFLGGSLALNVLVGVTFINLIRWVF